MSARQQMFLPYAYRERPPVDRHWFCADLAGALYPDRIATEIDARQGHRLGIVVTFSEGAERVGVAALMPHLPEGMFDVPAAHEFVPADARAWPPRRSAGARAARQRPLRGQAARGGGRLAVSRAR